MPAQLKRLIPLFILFITLFLIIRHLLIPDTFGQYGHYRGNALLDNEDKEIVHASEAYCVDCHDDVLEKLRNDVHAGLSCITCHGPGMEHVEDPAENPVVKATDREFCGRCHFINPSRPAGVVVQVNPEDHNPEFSECTDCHHPHEVYKDLL
jgi:hypothetical protein